MMKAVTFNTTDEAHKRFKIALAINGETAGKVLTRAMEDYADKSAVPANIKDNNGKNDD